MKDILVSYNIENLKHTHTHLTVRATVLGYFLPSKELYL